MGLLESYKGDILAAPAGNNIREVTLKFTGVTEMKKEEIAKLPINGMVTVLFNFETEQGEICSITRNLYKKSAQGKVQYNFVKNFIDKMRAVSDLDYGKPSTELIGKSFTILVFNNANNMVDYDIKTTSDDDTTPEDDSAF